jgi:hypothetical protein
VQQDPATSDGNLSGIVQILNAAYHHEIVGLRKCRNSGTPTALSKFYNFPSRLSAVDLTIFDLSLSDPVESV